MVFWGLSWRESRIRRDKKSLTNFATTTNKSCFPDQSLSAPASSLQNGQEIKERSITDHSSSSKVASHRGYRQRGKSCCACWPNRQSLSSASLFLSFCSFILISSIQTTIFSNPKRLWDGEGLVKLALWSSVNIQSLTRSFSLASLLPALEIALWVGIDLPRLFWVFTGFGEEARRIEEASRRVVSIGSLATNPHLDCYQREQAGDMDLEEAIVRRRGAVDPLHNYLPPPPPSSLQTILLRSIWAGISEWILSSKFRRNSVLELAGWGSRESERKIEEVREEGQRPDRWDTRGSHWKAGGIVF